MTTSRDALRAIIDEAEFNEDDGAMELGERLILIQRIAREAIGEHGDDSCHECARSFGPHYQGECNH